MARKREFNYELAIDQATRLFWAKGYTSTSLRELLRVMKIGESSFYNSLKSKRNLYLECLRRYNATVTAKRWNAFMAERSAKAGVRQYFKVVLDDLDDPKVPNVCLMAGSLAPDVLESRDLHEYVTGEIRIMEDAMVSRFQVAKQEGELHPGFDSAVATEVLITYLQGLFRVARVLKNRVKLERQIEALLAGLGL